MNAEQLFIKKLAPPLLLNKALELVKKYPETAAAPVGAALATGYQYLKNRPPKGGGKSSEQVSAEKRLQRAEESKKEDGDFKSEMSHTIAKAHHERASAMAKHPFRGAMLAAPAGALAAGSLVALGRRALKSI